MKLTWPAIYACLFLYRSVASALAITLLTQVTTLGDSHGYAALDYERGSEKAGGQPSNVVTFLIGYVAKTIFFSSEVMVGLVFQAIAFVGMVMLLSSLSVDLRKRLIAFFFVPSFTIWTSIAGKEALIVLFVCLVLKAAVDWAYRGRISIWQVALGLFGLALFKPHFLPATMFLLGMSVALPATRVKTLLVLGSLVVTVSILFALRPTLELYAPPFLTAHFVGDYARSSRPPFWTEYGDFFGKSAEGMYLSFVGPTFAETRVSVVHLFSFIESWIMLIAFAVLLFREGGRVPAFCFILGIGVLFWTLAPNYGTGVMNPGTAIRYRAGWLPIIFFCVTILMTRRFGEIWLETFRRRPKAAAPPASEISPARPA